MAGLAESAYDAEAATLVREKTRGALSAVNRSRLQDGRLLMPKRIRGVGQDGLDVVGRQIGCASRMSASVAPSLSFRRTSFTMTRVPWITGLPSITRGSIETLAAGPM